MWAVIGTLILKCGHMHSLAGLWEQEMDECSFPRHVPISFDGAEMWFSKTLELTNFSVP